MQAADFPVEAIRSQITEGVDIMIHMSRLRDGSRKIMEIAELDGMENGKIKVNVLFRYGEGNTGNGLVHKGKLNQAGYEEVFV